MKEKSRAQLLSEINNLLKQNKLLNKKLLKLSENKEKLDKQKLFSVIFDNAKLGITLTDLEGKLLLVNSYFAKLLKYSVKELLGKNFSDLTHPIDRQSNLILMKQLVSGKRKGFVIEKRYFRKDGEIVWAKVTGSGIFEKGKLVYINGLIENITEQKEFQKKLEAERNLFTTLMDNVPDSIYFKDINSKFIIVNKSKAEKHGFNKTEYLVGKSDFDLFDTEHANIAYNDEQEIIRTGKPIIGKEEKQAYKNGLVRWVSTTKMPFYDSEKNIIGTFGITRDISEAKKNEEALIQERERYRVLFESSADGIFLMTDIFEDCNNAVLEIFGCEREDIIGHHPAEFSPEYQPDGRNSTEKANEKIQLAMSGIPQKFYWKHKRKDNQLIDVEVALNAVTLQGRKLIQATVRDISERAYADRMQNMIYKISEAAQTSEDINNLYKKLHEIISELIPVKNFYIALYDDKNDLLTFPYFVDEYDPPQPPKKFGKGLTEYVIRIGEAALIDAKKDLELREKGEVELVGAPQAIWLGIPLKLGNKVIGAMVVQDYEDDQLYGEKEKQLLIFVSEQITQAITRKKNDEAIKKYTDELKQLNATKDKFFSIIAHDLKNPFITILGFSDLLLSDYNELTDEEILFYIEEMKKSADISHNLLQNLLQWSRSQTGRIEFNPVKLNLADLVKENFNLLNATATNKQIELISEVPDNSFINADEEMIKTILRNLISNAIKFTSKGGKVKICSKIQNNFIETCVEDTGIGMSEETMNKLFRLDVSHTSKGTDQETGTGLGLILCKEFVEKNNGTIRVESEPGKGSRFIFTLPTAA